MTLLHMYNNFIHTDIHVTKLLPYTSSICDFTYVNKKCKSNGLCKTKKNVPTQTKKTKKNVPIQTKIR